MEGKAENETSRSRHRRILAAKSPSNHSIRRSSIVNSSKAKKHISTAIHQPHNISAQQLQQVDMLENLLPAHLNRSKTPSRPDLEATIQRSLGSEFHIHFSSPSISLHSIPKTPCVAEREDWEIMAAKVIDQKKLYLNDLWSAYTWKNKTSIGVRLKLLKDNDYDITPLLGKRLSSSQVTDAVLAHIAARKQVLKEAAIQGSCKEEAGDEDEWVEKMVRMFLEDEIDVPVWQYTIKGEQPSIGIPIISEKMSRNEISCVSNDFPLSSHDIPSLIPQKRRHCHYDECESMERQRAVQHDTLMMDELQEGPCDCGPSPKKLRVMAPEETKKHIEKDAFRLFRRNICRAIFHLSSADHKDFKATQPVPTSSVHFAPPSMLSRHQVATNLFLGTRGLAYIIEEVKAFCDFQMDDDAILICDPDAFETDLGDNGNCRNISFSQDSQLGTLMMGDAYALAGLVYRIRKHDLIHTSEWVFNGMEVVRKDNRAWSLSHETLDVLAEIERMLLAGASGGMVKISVELFDNGERLSCDFH